MDFSSLPEAQQQQLRELQQQFQEHQLQQQQQQQQQEEEQAQQKAQQQQYQDYASQVYDPSQIQAYDQSYYSYYQYQEPQQSQHSQHLHQDQQQQHYSYYHTNYTNDYQQQPQQPQYPQQDKLQQQPRPESAPIHPPGVSIPGQMVSKTVESGGPTASSVSMGLGHGQVQVQHQQNSYYPKEVGPVGDQSNSVPSGLNPAAAAAVAALAQLTQFAGTMDAAERAMAGLQERQWHGNGGGHISMIGGIGFGPGLPMEPGPFFHGPGPRHPPVGQSPYKGGGGRGGHPYRGGGRGNFGSFPPRTADSGPPFRGRGRGQVRGGQRQSQPHETSSSYPEPIAAGEAETSEEDAEPSADNHEVEAQAEVLPQASALAQGNAAPNQRPTRVAWCELCKVDCTSLEILEQHKNGKKHKKNLQRLEKLKNGNKRVAEIQNEQKPVGDSNPQVTLQPKNIQECEENQILPENLSTEAVSDENKSEQKNDKVEHPDIPAGEHSNVQSRKPWMNPFDDQRRGMKRKMRGGRGGKRMKTFDAPRQPVGPPKPKVVIPLICDLCNVKCDTQEVFDRHLSGKKHIAKFKRFQGHQAMYGPIGLQALYPPNPITQTLFQPQGPQQAFYAPQGVYVPPQAHDADPLAASLDSGFLQNPNPQMSYITPEFGGQKPEAQQQVALVEPGTNLISTVQTYNGNVSGSEGTGLNPPLDNTTTCDDQVNA